MASYAEACAASDKTWRSLISDMRKASREWATNIYDPPDIIVPLEEVKAALANYMMGEHPRLVYDDFRRNAKNPKRILADVWHHCGRDVREVLKARGYESLPNGMLGESAFENGPFAGAHDLLVETPSPESDREHLKMALECKRAKQVRTFKLKENIEKSIERTAKDMDEWEDWLASA